MLIDWVSARYDISAWPADLRYKVAAHNDRIQRVSTVDGSVIWDMAAWQSVRSDSHQVSIKTDALTVWVSGSPARLFGNGCSVFGSGPASGLDLRGCVEQMFRFAFRHLLGDVLPVFSLACIKVSRVDITQNLLLSSLEEVKQALGILRNCEGGRYRVSQQAGDTVYWSHKSTIRSGKAYAKGPHLRYLNKLSEKTEGHIYSDNEIEKAERLIRLELSLKRHFFKRECFWQGCTPEILIDQWEQFFLRMIGNSELVSDINIRDKIEESASGKRQAKNAYAFWLTVEKHGWQYAKDNNSPNTFYRYQRILRDAGLGDADISAGKIVPFRRRIFEAQRVDSWSELYQMVNQ